MKKIIWIIAAVIFFAACNNSEKTADDSQPNDTAEISMENLVEVSIDVHGMTCEGCEQAVSKSVSSLEGIAEVKASHVDSVAVVKYDKSVATLEEIRMKIADAGYTVVE